jgi:uncharacterized protein YkwD
MKKLAVALALLVSGFVNSQILIRDYGDSLISATIHPFHSNNTIEYYLMFYINEERAAIGLPALKADTLLQQMARKHSQWMCKTGIYVHSGDPKCPTWKQHRIVNYAECCMMYHSIMILTHKDFAKYAVGAWMHSEGHRKQLMDPNFTIFGAGYEQRINRLAPHQLLEYYTIMVK